MKNINPTQTAAWQALQQHFDTMKDVQISQLFAEDADRFSKFSATFDDQMLVDYSKNRITQETLDKLHIGAAIHCLEIRDAGAAKLGYYPLSQGSRIDVAGCCLIHLKPRVRDAIFIGDHPYPSYFKWQRDCFRSLLGTFHKIGNTREARETGAGVEILRYTQKRSTLANALQASAVATQRIQPLRSINSPP